MDTSETYIKMHLKLPDEMKVFPDELDNYYNIEYDETDVYLSDDDYENLKSEIKYNPNRFLKIYRQDQLQEMVGGGWATKLSALQRFITESPIAYIQTLDRFEQLWLAFVMKEKYSRIWNGTDWIKEVTNEL